MHIYTSAHQDAKGKQRADNRNDGRDMASVVNLI